MRKTKLSSGLTVISVLFFLSLSLNSCLRDNFDFDKLTGTDWRPTLAVPLVNTHLDAYDIMANFDKSDLIVIDPVTGQMALVYKGELFSFDAPDIVDLPDQNTNYSVMLDAPGVTQLVGVGTVTTTQSEVYPFLSSAGVLLDSLELKSGTMSLGISSDFQHSGSITISMPGLRNSSGTFNKVIPLNYTSGPVVANQSYDLDGYTFDFTDGGTNSNVIPIDITLTLVNSGNPVTGAEMVDVAFGFNGFEFKMAYGDFGQQAISLDKDSIKVRIFSNASTGVFMLVDPRLRINVDNSFGFPIDIHIDTLETRNTNTGVITPINLQPQFPNPFAINFPNIAQIGVFAETDLVIDRNNSNIIDMMEPTPKWLIHNISAISNPDGPPITPNYLRDDSFFRVDTELELPLDGWADKWGISDTTEFEFSGENVDEIESVELRLIAGNYFPINMRLQAYLLDSNKVIIDSLFIDGATDIIKSGIIDSKGRVIEENTVITDIPFDQTRVPNLQAAKYFWLYADSETFEAEEGNSVKIYDDYYFNFRLGLKARAKVRL